ncbi:MULTISPECIES: helix-turn-helix transcriptional regulator [Kitasatospora]|uniref:Putative DNA-binding protein n=1 Tax=Kitasatospora setae (strain ATCC 33774 / DSM 43861 / JCM 3304 / KCC A-0304 / NBRC 14216 / KM-6054) TaxID=452652 RepID=E4NIU7_KITSK|nr:MULTISPECIES: helix-turn-helix transcriptional regulator [Kitasatospora]BAJ32895.1 putative DNA-binding protein [Kitasatospora setae KM-6054]
MPETPLGAFLRARRARLVPSEAGYAVSGRRRTPGLRREEVAARAGISPDYYARLEQGRQRVPTGPVLDGIADALHLADAERAYLHRLAGGRPLREREGDRAARAAVSASTLALLDTLDAAPAFVTGPTFDLLAWNRPAALLMAEPAQRPPHERNLLWQVFCCPYGSRAADNHAPDRSIGADLVASLRAHHADRPADRALADLVGRFSAASPAFAALWSQHRAGPPGPGRLHVNHPALDTEVLEYTVLALPEPGRHVFACLAPPGSRARDAFAASTATAGPTW